MASIVLQTFEAVSANSAIDKDSTQAETAKALAAAAAACQAHPSALQAHSSAMAAAARAAVDVAADVLTHGVSVGRVTPAAPPAAALILGCLAQPGALALGLHRPDAIMCMCRVLQSLGGVLRVSKSASKRKALAAKTGQAAAATPGAGDDGDSDDAEEDGPSGATHDVVLLPDSAAAAATSQVLAALRVALAAPSSACVLRDAGQALQDALVSLAGTPLHATSVRALLIEVLALFIAHPASPSLAAGSGSTAAATASEAAASSGEPASALPWVRGILKQLTAALAESRTPAEQKALATTLQELVEAVFQAPTSAQDHAGQAEAERSAAELATLAANAAAQRAVRGLLAALVQHIVMCADDAAERRAVLIQSVCSLYAYMTPAAALGLCSFVARLARTKQAAARCMAVDTAAALLQQPASWDEAVTAGASEERAPGASPSPGDGSGAQDASLEKAACAAADGAPLCCASVLLSRLGDRAASVRTRALAGIATLLSEPGAQLLTVVSDTLSGAQAVMLAVLCEAASAASAQQRGVSMLEITHVGDALHKHLRAALLLRARDERALVRRGAMHALAACAACPALKGGTGRLLARGFASAACLEAAGSTVQASASEVLGAGGLQVLAAACADSSVAVRRAAASELTAAVNSDWKTLATCQAWLWGVAPMALDADPNVAARVAADAAALLLQGISAQGIAPASVPGRRAAHMAAAACLRSDTHECLMALVRKAAAAQSIPGSHLVSAGASYLQGVLNGAVPSSFLHAAGLLLACGARTAGAPCRAAGQYMGSLHEMLPAAASVAARADAGSHTWHAIADLANAAVAALPLGSGPASARAAELALEVLKQHVAAATNRAIEALVRLALHAAHAAGHDATIRAQLCEWGVSVLQSSIARSEAQRAKTPAVRAALAALGEAVLVGVDLAADESGAGTHGASPEHIQSMELPQPLVQAVEALAVKSDMEQMGASAEIRGAALAVVARLCLRETKYARQRITVFVRELSDTGAPLATRSVALLALGDLLIRQPSTATRYLADVAAALRNTEVLLRRQALHLLSCLLFHEYIKCKDAVFLCMAPSLIDRDVVVASRAHELFCTAIPAKHPHLVASKFTELVLCTAGAQDHPAYARVVHALAAEVGSRASTGAADATAAAPHTDIAQALLERILVRGCHAGAVRARRDLWLATYKTLPGEGRLTVVKRLIVSVVQEAVHGRLPCFGEHGPGEEMTGGQLLREALLFIAAAIPMLATTSSSAPAGGTGAATGAAAAAASDPDAATDVSATQAMERAKSKLLSKLVAKGIVEAHLPALLLLRTQAGRERSPLQRDVALVCAAMWAHYKDPMKDVLAGDQALMQELAVDAASAQVAIARLTAPPEDLATLTYTHGPAAGIGSATRQVMTPGARGAGTPLPRTTPRTRVPLSSVQRSRTQARTDAGRASAWAGRAGVPAEAADLHPLKLDDALDAAVAAAMQEQS